MANYKGLNCIIPEITMMASNEKNPQHEQHIYDFFNTMEKYVSLAVPQLFLDCMERFKIALDVEIETYLNGQQINQGDIKKGVCKALQEAIDATVGQIYN